MTIDKFKEMYDIHFYSYEKNPLYLEFYSFITLKEDSTGQIITRHNDKINKNFIKQLNVDEKSIRDKFMRALAHNCLIEFDIEGYDPLNKKNDINILYDESI
jgi:hypothetical protein